MAADIPVIPKVESVLVHTGNIVNWNRLKRKLTQAPTEELSECIGSTITDWLDGEDRNELQYSTSISSLNSKFIEKIEETERDGLKITVKLFLCEQLEKDVVEESVKRVMEDIGVTSLETVLLSVPEAHRNMKTIQPLWEALEKMSDDGKIYSLGVSDLDRDQLEELHNSARVKPCINQVILDSCCVIPPELSAFAKENDIQLLTHSDPKDLMPVKTFQEVMANHLSVRDGEGWEPLWTARYSILIKQRGIVKSKGYVFKAVRDLKKR